MGGMYPVSASEDKWCGLWKAATAVAAVVVVRGVMRWEEDVSGKEDWRKVKEGEEEEDEKDEEDEEDAGEELPLCRC